jgi:hypothetical protein
LLFFGTWYTLFPFLVIVLRCARFVSCPIHSAAPRDGAHVAGGVAAAPRHCPRPGERGCGLMADGKSRHWLRGCGAEPPTILNGKLTGYIDLNPLKRIPNWFLLDLVREFQEPRNRTELMWPVPLVGSRERQGHHGPDIDVHHVAGPERSEPAHHSPVSNTILLKTLGRKLDKTLCHV